MGVYLWVGIKWRIQETPRRETWDPFRSQCELEVLGNWWGTSLEKDTAKLKTPETQGPGQGLRLLKFKGGSHNNPVR